MIIKFTTKMAELTLFGLLKKQNNKKQEDEIKKYQFMVMKYVTNAQKIEVITMQYARKVF